MSPKGNLVARLALLTLELAAAAPAHAETDSVPAPKAIIYPGDLITDDMLADIPAPSGVSEASYALTRSALIGRMARRTLLPGRPITLRAIDNLRLVRNGAEVQLIYVDGGLTIATKGAALQDGSVGEVIRIRNNDSGVTVSGAVQADGSVRVGGG